MTDFNPFIYRYGVTEGRLAPTEYPPQDERHVYVLGSEGAEIHNVRTGDRVEVYQDVDLTDIYMVRIAAGLWQPSGMPVARRVSGLPANASLKFQEVLPRADTGATRNYPALVCESYPPYRIYSGDTLRYQMTVYSGGVWSWDAPVTITFMPGDAGFYDADELSALLNPKLTNATTTVVGSAPRDNLKLWGAQPPPSDKGRYAALRVIGGTFTRSLRFPLGPIVREIAGDAADTLTVSTKRVHLVNGNFTAPDIGRQLKITGSASINNGYPYIKALFGPQDAELEPGPLADETGPFLLSSKKDGLYDPRVAYGGDDLSAIIAPDGNFTEADAGLPLRIAGATNPINNFVNFITSVQDSNTAILKYGVASEGPGFDAFIVGALWKAEVRIDTTLCYSHTPDNGKKLLTNDIAVNVSKLSGVHRVKFAISLVSALT
jgi:hypothetical protein